MNNIYERMAELIYEQILIAEGRTTGGEGTAERLGRWHGSRDLSAKPGQPGYMRKRNVPPTDPKHPETGKYDPRRHKPPVSGKPLEYIHPEHEEYARAGSSKVVGNVAARQAEKGDVRDRPTSAQTQEFMKFRKQGHDTLKKHGWKPPIRRAWVHDKDAGKMVMGNVKRGDLRDPQ